MPVLLVVTLTATGCSRKTAPPDPVPVPNVPNEPPVSQEQTVVLFRMLRFVPKDSTVTQGTVVMFINDDLVEHDVKIFPGTVTDPTSGSIADSPYMQPGGRWDYTFTEPGLYKLYCLSAEHWRLGMVGTIKVVSD
ncbi:MAG: hypothetical protein HYY09_07620 [Firmicutes bacterium]|nr:hypothetical protein [Bacillota bacterium]